MQLAPGMCPAIGQRQGHAAHALWFGQGVIAGISIDLKNDLEACQDVHRMAAVAPRRIGEDDGWRIASTPTAIIAGHRPKVAGFGFTCLGIEDRRSGLVHEQAAGPFEVDQHPVDARGQMIGRHTAPVCQG
jgi:hypothetical protein